MTTSIRDTTVSGLLREAARRHGDACAVASPERDVRWSFQELDRRADEVAAGCIAAGLAAGDRAVVWATNLPEWIALQYGLAKAGVVLVTSNTAFKLDEIRYIVEQSDARALFFGRGPDANPFEPLVDELVRSRPARLERLVGVDGADAGGSTSMSEFVAAGRSAAAEVDAREQRLERGHVINMQYTSGTTGFPKGVMLSHDNIVANASAIADPLRYGPDDRLCLCVPLFHCFGCVIGTLCAHGAGVTLVLNEAFQPDAILDTVESERCTAIYGVPTMFVAELEKQRERRRDLTSLRVGVMAGSSCPEALMREVIDEFPLPGLVVAYGLTEASPGITMSRPEDPIDFRATTVGRALPDVEVRIADPASGEAVTRGETGELWSRGPNTMLGYDKDEEATRRAITPDGWLRSGDLARETPDGAFQIVGRIKELIIRGGENISPVEVEDALRAHPAVADAAAFPVSSAFFGEEVAAAVRIADGQRADEAELRRFLSGRIADHKIPSRLLFVDEFPLTGSGKVKRFLLREMAER